MLKTLLLALVPLSYGQAPSVVAESRPGKHVICVMEDELHLSEAYQLNELVIVGAAAPELPHHQVKVRTKLLSPTGGELGKEADWPFRPFVATHLRSAGNQRTFPIKIQYEAYLMERRLVPAAGRKSAAPALDAKTREGYLAATDLYDFKTPEFGKWIAQAGLQRDTRESTFAFAQRAYLGVGKKFSYKAATSARPASQVIALTEADCDTLSYVYIAALRANGVPARMLLGRPAAKSVKPTETGRMPGHAVVEFFADEVGWVICDPTGAVQGRKNPLHNFGHSDHFLVMQVEPSIKVPGAKADSVRTVRSLTSPSYAVRGKGKAEGKLTHVGWTVTIGP